MRAPSKKKIGLVGKSSHNILRYRPKKKAKTIKYRLLTFFDKVEVLKSKKRRMFRRGGTAIKGFMQSIGTGGGRLRDFARRRRK